MWQRSLIAWPDGRRDTTTAVRWLQGPGFYIDLRQAAGRPDFAGVAGLADLDADQLRWLAGQEGFAGELVFDGSHFEWQRLIDFQPQAVYSDAGSLRFEGDTLVEEGRDLPYIEHWHRDAAATAPCAAARLANTQDGRRGFIVRSGPRFMYARDRALALPDLPSLGDAVEAAADLDTARALVDCELSFGDIGPDGWTIRHSSLPFREGADLNPMAAGGPGDLVTLDTAPDGTAATRTWRVETLQGAFDDLLAFTLPRATALSR
ncbi:hypothetical protein D3874_14215 [Oleomonas cavernae]|uniref:Uncharacterized protein n=1 Tax=Oleomonas cavernae TaxID=2320859 RepID=A0A418WDK6_9PROT|nr:hypothetical protein D3874_14215 [Oleomonas cavernae]